ncbi:MAG TPA: alpha/beta fold hydrolase [Acidimicrobiales bacterium]|nr:alpha/beta fold hydrolase [Acidimicrobiales bacterium]
MAGEGPAILMIHGIAGSSGAWREVMPALAEQYTVIAPDLLGHGQSAKPTGDYSLGAYANVLRDLLGVVGIPRATVVGQSFGGGVAMQFCYQNPEWCERLVLVDSGGLGREVSWLLRFMTLPGAEYLMPIIFPPFVGARGDELSRLLYSRGIRMPRVGEMWRSYASLTDGANRQSFIRTIRSVIDPGGQTVSAMDRLYLTQQVPTLIVWGEHDSIIPVSHAHDAHAAMPNSRLEIVAGAGHFPHVEAPGEFLRALRDFMETTVPATLEVHQFQRILRERAHAMN